MKHYLTLTLFSVSAIALVGCSSMTSGPSTESQGFMEKLTPKTGKPFLTLQGSGVQIFRCMADSKGAYWKFEQPQAKLIDKAGETVAELSGPMNAFEYKDGSRIISTHIISWADAANPQVDNKYALMRAISDPGSGEFNGVKFVQRLNPKGGMPNDTSCSAQTQGKLLKVPFSAEYVFWK